MGAAIEEPGRRDPVGLRTTAVGAARKATARHSHFYDAPTRMLEFIFSGVLDRYPDLMVFLAEVDCGWMPYFAQQADDNYSRTRTRC